MMRARQVRATMLDLARMTGMSRGRIARLVRDGKLDMGDFGQVARFVVGVQMMNEPVVKRCVPMIPVTEDG